MTVRREVSGTELLVYTQTWSIDSRLIGVTKALSSGLVLAQTSYFFDGDGVRVRKDDPDGTTLYVGVVEHIIGEPGTAMAEYYDDISGPTLTGYMTTRSEPVVAGLQRSYTTTPPLPTMGDAPWAIRWQLWLTVPVTDTYTFAVQADDGFSLSGIGPALTNTTTRALTTTEASSGVVLTPGLIYNFSLAYMNYTTATPAFAGAGCTIQLLWRRAGGALEIVPREAIHARGRRDYYSFAGAPVAMKEGVMGSVTRTLSYLHGDHLGSASLTTDISGTVVSQQRYKPYGEVRWTSGAGMPTDKQFTGQTRLVEGYVGTLYDYVARAYDPVLGRFISPDTIVPGAGSSQAFNRYSYVGNNPLRFVDPSGHVEANPDLGGCGATCNPPATSPSAGPFPTPTPPAFAPSVFLPSPPLRFSWSYFKMNEANAVFADMADEEDIPFQFPNDGCYARAEAMIQRISVRYDIQRADLRKAGIQALLLTVDTVYDYDDFGGNAVGDGKIYWNWHIAPSIPVMSDGRIVYMVIDPSIASGPVTLSEWAAIAHPNPKSTEAQLLPADAYASGSTIGLWSIISSQTRAIYQDKMSKTLNEYLARCRAGGYCQ